MRMNATTLRWFALAAAVIAGLVPSMGWGQVGSRVREDPDAPTMTVTLDTTLIERGSVKTTKSGRLRRPSV